MTRTVAVTKRWKPQTSFWRASQIAEATLVEWQVGPSEQSARTHEEWMQRLYDQR